jgi:hypothetical protein
MSPAGSFALPLGEAQQFAILASLSEPSTVISFVVELKGTYRRIVTE